LLPDVELGERELDDEALTPVLEDQIGRRLTLSAVVPEVLAETPKLRVILSHLERYFGRRERPRNVVRIESLSLGA
jgi:hypothetical protein